MTLIEEMFEYHKGRRDSYARQVEMLETGVMTTRTNHMDTTAESLADARQCLAATEKFLA